MKFYVDTSVWRDYFEDRKDDLRPLGEFAFLFFKKVKEDKDLIFFSKLVLEELAIKYNIKEIKEMFDILSTDNSLLRVKVKKKHILKAKKLSNKVGVHFGDCLHAVLAKENKAILVTRDKHFDMLKTFIEVRKPEDLF